MVNEVSSDSLDLFEAFQSHYSQKHGVVIKENFEESDSSEGVNSFNELLGERKQELAAERGRT